MISAQKMVDIGGTYIDKTPEGDEPVLSTTGNEGIRVGETGAYMKGLIHVAGVRVQHLARCLRNITEHKQ